MTLQRRTPLHRTQSLGPRPRAKGNRGELSIIKLFHEHGFPHARRNFQSGGQGGGDIIDGPPGFNHEVKHQEACRMWEWIAQSEADARPSDTPLVWFRRNRSRWYAVIPAEDLLGLIQHAEGLG